MSKRDGGGSPTTSAAASKALEKKSDFHLKSFTLGSTVGSIIVAVISLGLQFASEQIEKAFPEQDHNRAAELKGTQDLQTIAIGHCNWIDDKIATKHLKDLDEDVSFHVPGPVADDIVKCLTQRGFDAEKVFGANIIQIDLTDFYE